MRPPFLARLIFWAPAAALVFVAVGGGVARAGDSAYMRAIGWNREANAIVFAEWPWPGPNGAFPPPMNVHVRPFDVDGMARGDAHCEWPAGGADITSPAFETTCRWRTGGAASPGAPVRIRRAGDAVPANDIALERARRGHDVYLTRPVRPTPRHLLWLGGRANGDSDLRGVYRMDDWFIAIVHTAGDSLQGIPWDVEEVVAFPGVWALDSSDPQRTKAWSDWLVARAFKAPSVNLPFYRTASEVGPLPFESVVPAMQAAEAEGRLDLAELFYRRGGKDRLPEELRRLNAMLDSDQGLARTRRLLKRAARR